MSNRACPAVSSAAIQGQQQQQLLLSELKRVGTQQEQLKKAVSEAIAFADAQGESLEIAHLKSFPQIAKTNSRLPESTAALPRQQTQPAGKTAATRTTRPYTGNAAPGLHDASANVPWEAGFCVVRRLLEAKALCHAKGCSRQLLTSVASGLQCAAAVACHLVHTLVGLVWKCAFPMQCTPS